MRLLAGLGALKGWRVLTLCALMTPAALAAGCGESATETGKACAQSDLIAQCPGGSNPVLGAAAESSCSGKASGSYIKEEGSATGQCQGTGSCVVACQFASPCTCDVESATKDGVICRPCPDQSCGDGKCTGTERPTCAAGQLGCVECGIDCNPKCGDGVCNGDEGPTTCPEDCAKTCTPSAVECLGTKLRKCASDGTGWVIDQDCSLLGNYKCDMSTGSCVPASVCGNGVCDVGEDNTTCPKDCQQCAANEISCEVNPGTKQCVSQDAPAHCGTCTNDCTAKEHVQPAKMECQSGLCVVPSGGCGTGWADCDGNGANGCEQTLNAPDNCGACGTTCLAGNECVGGQCVKCADNGKLDCNGQCVPSDENNCGACGVQCPGGTCVNGHCSSCSFTVADLYGSQGMKLSAGATGLEGVCPNMPPGTVSVVATGTMSVSGSSSISAGFGLDAAPWSTCVWANNDWGETMFQQSSSNQSSLPFSASVGSYAVPNNGTVSARICMGYCNGGQGATTCTFDAVSQIKISANP